MKQHQTKNLTRKMIFLRSQALDSLLAISPHIPNNRNDQGFPNKPLFLAVKDKYNDNIYWAVPITSRVDKYKRIQAEYSKTHRRSQVERFLFYKLRGREACFNISGMMPIHKIDIESIYIHNGSPVKIKQAEEQKIISNVSTFLTKEHLRKTLVLNTEKLYTRCQQIDIKYQKKMNAKSSRKR